MTKNKFLILLLSILSLSVFFLKLDVIPFLIWSAAILFIGLLFYPLSAKLFYMFNDQGYLFSKTIGIAVSSYLVWLVTSLHLAPFSNLLIGGVCLVLGGLIFFGFQGKVLWSALRTNKDLSFHVVVNECIFLLTLLIWTYLRGLRPDIHGLEKFMDFGFVNTILRSDFMPPVDMWFSGLPINYYYYGHFVTAFLTKMTGIPSAITYNLMMATLFAFTFALTYSLVSNMIRHFEPIKTRLIYTGGLISAFLISFGGNLHTFFFAWIFPTVKNGVTVDYWYPDATRYIGYFPETNDKTIHEFPHYSFIVSDLHAHVLDMIFVLALLATLFALVITIQKLTAKEVASNRYKWRPELLLIAFLIGIFKITNFWDFPIYMTVSLSVLVYTNLKRYPSRFFALGITALEGIGIYLISALLTLPFTLHFNQISTSIKFAEAHTYFYQLLVLWGYQFFFSISFILWLLFHSDQIHQKDKIKQKVTASHSKNPIAFNKIKLFWDRLILRENPTDIFVLILSLCALGLILLPEIIYVVDIYTGSHKRANTMFKLTYQAFIMFTIISGYAYARLNTTTFINKHDTLRRSMLLFLILPMIYPFYTIPGWYGNLFEAKYKGLSGIEFLRDKYSDDYDAVQWFTDNVQGQPVILESDGDSYSDYGRISMATGLPTVAGWKVHEWLWRSIEQIDARSLDVKSIYEADTAQKARVLIEKYQIEYLIIGKLERDKYLNLKESILTSLGEIVFQKNDMTIIHIRGDQ